VEDGGKSLVGMAAQGQPEPFDAMSQGQMRESVPADAGRRPSALKVTGRTVPPGKE